MAVDVVVYDKVGKESEKIQDALYALYPQATITDAAIASFDDGSDGIPVKELVVAVEPVQAGTGDPSPDNIRPISGWTGANVTKAGKNILSWFGYTKTGWYCRLPNVFAKLPLGTNLMFSIDKLDSESHGFAMQLLDANESTIGTLSGYDFGNTVFTRTWAVDNTFKTAKYFRLAGNWYGLTKELCDAVHFQIEIGTTRTSYEAPASEISVTFPSSAGTVYGGTLTVNPDRTGQLVVDKVGVDLGTLNWSDYQPDNHRFGAVLSVKAVNYSAIQIREACSIYRLSLTGPAALSNGNGRVYDSGKYSTFYMCDERFTDVSEIASALSGQTLVYSIVTPVTYTLTASEIDGILSTLYGTNNIWADCGDIEKLTYRADLGKYIDSHITTAVANALNA